MFVDLSVEINNQTPVYPGDPPISITPAGVLVKDGFNDHLVSIGTHVGTHMDAPRHMIKGGKNLDQYPIDAFVGPGRVIKMQANKYDLEELKQEGIQEGDIVLFYSGISQHYHDKEYFEDYPAMPAEVAQYLVDQKIKIVGLDMCSPDHEEFIAHKILLGGGVLIIENLTNLDKILGQQSTIYALPLKLQVDGAPARVIAEV